METRKPGQCGRVRCPCDCRRCCHDRASVYHDCHARTFPGREMNSRSSPLLTYGLPPPRSLLRLTPAASKELPCGDPGLGSCPELATAQSPHSTANLGQMKEHVQEWRKEAARPRFLELLPCVCLALCWLPHCPTPLLTPKGRIVQSKYKPRASRSRA